MRKVGIDLVERRLHGGRFNRADDERAKIAAALPTTTTCCAREMLRDFVFDGSAERFVAGVEDDEVL